MIPEDQDPVWKLLTQLPPVPVRNDFEASVLAEVEKQGGKERTIIPFRMRLPIRTLSAIAATVAISLSIWALMQSETTTESFTADSMIPASSENRGESVAELRQLYQMEDLLHDHDIDSMADEEIALLLFATSQ